MALREHVKRLEDKPLTEERELFVDRDRELAKLADLGYYFEGKVIGLCGERGVGKTTLINFARFPGKNKLIIHVVDRENKVAILGNIVAEITVYAERKGYSSIAEEGKRLLAKIQEVERKSYGLSYLLTYSVERERKVMLLNIIKDLSKLLERLSAKEKLVIILDEIDKESPREILLVIDALKGAFSNNPITLIVTLPYEMYSLYLSSKVEASATYNLENVFSYMFSIPPFSDDDIVEILKRRFPLELVEERALQLIVRFANGNPRKAITLLKEAGMLARERIREEDVRAVLHQYLTVWVRRKGIGEGDLKAIKALHDGEVAQLTRELSKKLRKSRSAIYKLLQRLEEKGVVEVKGGKVALTRMGELVREIL